MKSCALGFAVLLMLPLLCPAQQMKLPVFFLRYDGGVGMKDMNPDEIEEEDLETYSSRNKGTLRIKEQWSAAFTTNLYTAVANKSTLSKLGSDYVYFYLNPDFSWDITDRLQWSSGFRCKWIDCRDDSMNLNNLLAKTELTFKLLDDLKLAPFVQGVLDLYENVEKKQQTYTAGLNVESRLGREMRLNGRYRGIWRVTQDTAGEASEYLNHEFGVNLSWDPNR